MSTQTDIENLIYHLNLSPYQAAELYRNRNLYNMSRLQMRGGVLYAPRSGGIIERICGTNSGDLIGRRRTFMRGARRVQLIAGGYYTGCVGRSVLYGAPDGRAISPTEFYNMKSRN